MDIETQVPVFTVINEKGSLRSDFENAGKSVIYFTVDEEGTLENTEFSEAEETTSYLVQDNAVLQQFDASTVFNSDVKIITLNNERFFYITTDDDENVQSIEPHLITSQDTDEHETEESEPSASTTENNEIPESEDSKIDIKFVEPYEMIMLNEIEEPDILLENTKKKFKCLYTGCEKVYSTSQHLTVHMRNHMKRKPYACTFQGCEKNFATNYSLTAHWRTHTGEKPYTCQICFKSFKTSGDLQKHVRTHTGEKPFVCPVEGCGKSFTTSNIRKVHVRSHTGERPYVCDYPNCGKAFSSSTNYKNHARIHSGEKPFSCNVKSKVFVPTTVAADMGSPIFILVSNCAAKIQVGCEKKFTEYSSLYKHNAVHQVEKPHECNYCKQKFKSEHTLNVHRKVKHGVLVSPEGVQLLDLASLGFPSRS